MLYTLIFLVARNKISNTTLFIGKHSLLFALVISVAGVVGSIMFSEVLHFQPCKLCWVQRIFLFPQAILFFLAIWRKDYKIWFYTLPLSIIGGLVAIYHAYTQIWGGSLLPCTAEGGACSKVFFVEYGFITIPAMSAIAFLMLVFLALHSKYYSTQQ